MNVVHIVKNWFLVSLQHFHASRAIWQVVLVIFWGTSLSGLAQENATAKKPIPKLPQDAEHAPDKVSRARPDAEISEQTSLVLQNCLSRQIRILKSFVAIILTIICLKRCTKTKFLTLHCLTITRFFVVFIWI